jgi:hypothetical protein
MKTLICAAIAGAPIIVKAGYSFAGSKKTCTYTCSGKGATRVCYRSCY